MWSTLIATIFIIKETIFEFEQWLVCISDLIYPAKFIWIHRLRFEISWIIHISDAVTDKQKKIETFDWLIGTHWPPSNRMSNVIGKFLTSILRATHCYDLSFKLHLVNKQNSNEQYVSYWCNSQAFFPLETVEW